ncbi:MAG TPA: hypothetical protein VL137_03515 [Polyangiaceae bacterium]|jgi:hypothetical protein|nr:hypothetical protein [Polyangiaceae bacterium]
MPRLRRRLLLLAFVASAAVSSCLSSPTLPLPPPSPAEPTVPINGQTLLSGNIPTNDLGVRVLAQNARTQLIYGQSTISTHYAFYAGAQSGDVFVIWYAMGGERSEPVQVVVPFPHAALTPVPCAGSSCVDSGANAAPADAGDGG